MSTVQKCKSGQIIKQLISLEGEEAEDECYFSPVALHHLMLGPHLLCSRFETHIIGGQHIVKQDLGSSLPTFIRGTRSTQLALLHYVFYLPLKGGQDYAVHKMTTEPTRKLKRKIHLTALNTSAHQLLPAKCWGHILEVLSYIALIFSKGLC